MSNDKNNWTRTEGPQTDILSHGEQDEVVEKINELIRVGQYDDEDEESAKEREWRETVNFDDIDDDDDDEVFISTPIYRPVQSYIVKRRCFSECSDSGKPSSGSSSTASQHEPRFIRRDRSRSEPAVPPGVDVESLARELRRVSDEFHSLYTSPRHTPSRPNSGQNFFASAGSRLLENVCDHMLGRQLRPVRRQRSYSESTPTTYKGDY